MTEDGLSKLEHKINDIDRIINRLELANSANDQRLKSIDKWISSSNNDRTWYIRAVWFIIITAVSLLILKSP